LPRNSRLWRQFYGRGKDVTSDNRYHQKRVYPAIGETSMYLRIFFKNFYAFLEMPETNASAEPPAMPPPRVSIPAESPGRGGYTV